MDNYWDPVMNQLGYHETELVRWNVLQPFKAYSLRWQISGWRQNEISWHTFYQTLGWWIGCFVESKSNWIYWMIPFKVVNKWFVLYYICHNPLQQSWTFHFVCQMVPKKGCQFTILGFKDDTPLGRCWYTVYMKWTFSSLEVSVDMMFSYHLKNWGVYGTWVSMITRE